MDRVFTDCRETPSVSNCSLKIAGTADEVVRAAALHMVDVHGHEDTPELREEIRESLKPEVEETTYARTATEAEARVEV